MRWRVATRLQDGVRERRCGNAKHEGERWLPLTQEHFYLNGQCRWCRICQRRYMRERWRAMHPPKPQRAALKREAWDAGPMLQQLTAGWGKR